MDSIGKIAKLISVSEQTLRNWDKSWKLKPKHVAESGYSYYLNLNSFIFLVEIMQKLKK